MRKQHRESCHLKDDWHNNVWLIQTVSLYSGSGGKQTRGFSKHRESCLSVQKKSTDWPSPVINTQGSSGVIRTGACVRIPGHLLLSMSEAFSVSFNTLIKLCSTKALEWSSLVPGPRVKSSSEITNLTPFGGLSRIWIWDLSHQRWEL